MLEPILGAQGIPKSTKNCSWHWKYWYGEAFSIVFHALAVLNGFLHRFCIDCCSNLFNFLMKNQRAFFKASCYLPNLAHLENHRFFPAICCYLLLCAAFCCYLLLLAAICCYVLLFAAMSCYLLPFAAVCCCMLLVAAICCYLLLFAANCCYLLLLLSQCF